MNFKPLTSTTSQFNRICEYLEANEQIPEAVKIDLMLVMNDLIDYPDRYLSGIDAPKIDEEDLENYFSQEDIFNVKKRINQLKKQ